MATIDDLKMDMDPSALFEEKIITDRKLGTIRVLTPVTEHGALDLSRKSIFVGEAQIMTQMGAIPISFEIPADDIAGAVRGYEAAARKGVEDTFRKIEELREKAAHRIVTPGSEGFQVPPQAGGQGGSGILGL